MIPPPEWQDFHPLPRFITRWPKKNAIGRQIIRMQILLGSRPMPWQQLAAHAVGERLDDGTPRNGFIFITVPRQSGKTTSAGAWMNHRALTHPKSKVWYTAQTGQKARDRWLEMTQAVSDSVFQQHARVAKSNGAEALRWPNGSQVRPHPPTENSLHSEQSDLNVIDEAWAYDELQADLLMQAITPTQTTRPMRQTIVLSTEGTGESTWLHRHIDLGRAGDPSVFLIDFGISPQVDPSDLQAVAAAHPAFGYTLDMAALEDAHKKMGLAGFARGYGNRRTGAVNSLIAPATIEAATLNNDFPADAIAVLGAAIDMDRTETAIAAATWLGDRPFIEVIEVRPGTKWAADRIAHLFLKGNVEGVAVDQVGPSGTLHATLAKNQSVKLITPNVRQLSTAVAEIMDRLNYVDKDGLADPQIWFRRDPALDAAFENVDRRAVGDTWLWDRKGSVGSIAALEAATLALHGLMNVPKKARAPFIR